MGPKLFDHSIMDDKKWFDAMLELQENLHTQLFDKYGEDMWRVHMNSLQIPWATTPEALPHILRKSEGDMKIPTKSVKRVVLDQTELYDEGHPIWTQILATMRSSTDVNA